MMATATGAERSVPEGGGRSGGRRAGRSAVAWLASCLVAVGSVAAAPTGPGLAAAQTMSPPHLLRGVLPDRVPSDEELKARGAVIGKVFIRNENIFDLADPQEDNRLFRLANHLHVKTRPWVIRDQLLFRTGDPYDRRVLDESERILRSNRFFYDARIRPVAWHDGRVDVEVVTRDVWTLQPGISFGRQGGANTISVDIEELNLLGTGIGFGVSRAQKPDRDTFSTFLNVPRIGKSWIRTELFVAENSDGRTRSVLVERPFYALDTRRAAGADFADDLRVDTPFGRAGFADRYQTRQRKGSVWGGWSRGLRGGWVTRYTLGFTGDESWFAPAPGEVPSGALPPDRILAYPWVGVELVEDEFEKARNRDQIARTEDFFLGMHVQASLGYANTGFGADRAAAVFAGKFGKGFHPVRSSTVFVDAAGDGRYEGGSVRDATVGAEGRLYLRLSEDWLVYSFLSASRGINLDPDHELVLGGETGLRGYPRRYQAGDRRALFTLEARYYTAFYPFRLFRLGGAVFYDMGRAWGAGFAKAGDPGVLRDAGVGLRIGNARSALGRVIHVDMAFPLDGDPSISRAQFVVETKIGF